MLQLIQEGILLLGTATGAVTDAKTGYIYDWITYPMLILGIILSVMQAQWLNLISGAVIFGVLFLTYRLGKIGGGDVKIFSAIAFLNPYNSINFLATVALVAAAGAIIFYSTYYLSKYFRTNPNLEENKKGMNKAFVFGAMILFYFALIISLGLMRTESALMMLVPLIFGVLFVAFQEGISRKFFEEKIALSKLEEDEVIAQGRNDGKVNAILKGAQVIGEREKQLLKRKGIKYLYVMRKLPPFGPFILLGVIAATLHPELAMFLFV